MPDFQNVFIWLSYLRKSDNAITAINGQKKAVHESTYVGFIARENYAEPRKRGGDVEMSSAHKHLLHSWSCETLRFQYICRERYLLWLDTIIFDLTLHHD